MRGRPGDQLLLRGAITLLGGILHAPHQMATPGEMPEDEFLKPLGLAKYCLRLLYTSDAAYELTCLGCCCMPLKEKQDNDYIR